MNERLAFFCNRDTASCHLYTWAGADEAEGQGETRYQVFCRAAVDSTPPDADGPALDLATIRTWVAVAAGGLIAETRPVGIDTQLRVLAMPAAGYVPATRLLLLRPGLEPQWQPIGDDPSRLDPIRLTPGAFVLLPATDADQADLQALLTQLERLPGDYRDLLLNVLRRPGLEGALRRLEPQLARLVDQLDQRSPGATGADWHQTPPSSAGRWPWVLAGLLVLNLVGTLGTGWWGGRPSADSTGAAPSHSFERLLTPVPGADWLWCGPPWFCREPLAPVAPGTASTAAPVTFQFTAEKSRGRH